MKTTNVAHIARVKQPDKTNANPHASEIDADWAGDLSGTNATFHHGIPLTKPPYGQLTAVDLNAGTIRWQVPFGDWQELKKNPALSNVKLPEVTGVAGPAGTMATKGGLVFVGGGDHRLHAYDEMTGKELWQADLPSASHGSPMTYRTSGGKQYVVVASGIGSGATLVAFSLE